MRIGIISDIHGNMTALDAVLADLQTRQVEATYCLGDLVGYAAHPNEVTERIRAAGIPTIVGNYDDGWASSAMNAGAPIRTPSTKRSAINRWRGRRPRSRPRTRRSCARSYRRSGSRLTAAASCWCTAARAG
jgi:hypothetical protein